MTTVNWVSENFRFRNSDDLELLTTVDFAALNLKRANTAITLDAIPCIIAKQREERQAKRELFSDINIARTLHELWQVFPATYEDAHE